MPTTTIEIKDAQGRFAELVSLAAGGTEVVLTENSVPRARLIPEPTPKQRIPGLHAGSTWVSDDFDAPLPDDFWTGST
jgi:prevent-host-death family protein